MDARQLQYVVAVAEERSFTRAAQRCHVAQSALSHQVARLEAEIGNRLFERTSRSVHLSEAGRLLLPHARRVLDDMADARSALGLLASVAEGRLRIGMTQTANRVLDLITLIGEYHRLHPDIPLTTMTGPGHELIDAVTDSRLDLAFGATTGRGMPAEVAFETLVVAEPLVAVVPSHHRLASRKQVRIQELAADPFIAFLSGTTLREVIDGAFGAAGIEPTVNFEIGQLSEIVDYVANGLGISIVPRAFTSTQPARLRKAPEVQVLRLVQPPLHLTEERLREPGGLGQLLHGRATSFAAGAYLRAEPR